MRSTNTYTSVPFVPLSLRCRPTIPKPCSGLHLLGRHRNHRAIRKQKAYMVLPVPKPRLHTGFGPQLPPMLEDAPDDCPRGLPLQSATSPPKPGHHSDSADAVVPDTPRDQPHHVVEEFEGRYIVELEGHFSSIRLAEETASLPCKSDNPRMPPETNHSLYWATDLAYLRRSRQTGATPLEVYNDALTRRSWPLRDNTWILRDATC